MSGSDRYLRGLVAAAGRMDWGAAVREAVADLGKGASRFLADVGGVSQRTAERWIAKATERPSQASTPKPMAQVKIVEAMQRRAAANRVRRSPNAHAGNVSVAYSQTGRDEGNRHIGTVELDPDALDAIAAAVERGDYEHGGELLDAAVLDAYGVPEGALEIDEYEDGFWLD